MHHLSVRLSALLILLFFLGACTKSPNSSTPVTTPPPGRALEGEKLFNATLQLVGAPNCSVCHVLAPGEEPIVGPNLSNLAKEAGTRKPGMSAKTYLREALIEPNAFVVKGYQAGIMPQNYGYILTKQQLEDLVAYLLTLGE
jgi:mono/diheme cytochrome c family protein